VSIVSIRPGGQSDQALLFDSFIRTYGNTPHARGTPSRILEESMLSLLASDRWRFDIACATDEPTEILGMFVYRTGVPQRAAWLHVKQIWRGKGVARALLNHAGFRAGEVECAFLDPDSAKFAATKGFRLRFRPYLPAVALFDSAKVAR
jgi:GNAT superfamily N-acetyltransferase